MKDAIVTFARRMARDTKYGVVIGVGMGVFFCVVALAILIFRGRGPFDRNQVSVLRLLLTYLSAGALGGLILGLTMPLTKWLPGAALVAFLVAFLVWFCVGWSISPLQPLPSIVHTSAVLGAAFGLPIGVGFWIQGRIYDRTGKWY
jgi:hypothetical protein